MGNKNNIPVKSDETTGSGGAATTVKKTMYILGHGDTQIVSQGVFDEKGQEILAKVSLRDMGNEARKARKGKERVVYDKFGRESTREAVKESQKNSEKAPQHTLANVLGLSNMPGPGPGIGGPRPR